MIARSAESERTSQLTWVARRDPDRALALLAAPAAARDALTLLFVLDLRLAAVADRQGEAAAALLRLAWWRDALTALDNAAAPAEPMLQAVSKILISQGITGASLARIAEGWLALVEGEFTDPAAIDEHGAERGGSLFTIAGRLCGVADDRLALAGAGWALAERAGQIGDSVLAARLGEAARARLARLGSFRWPRRLRVLGTLVVLARRDLDQPARRSRPARLLRALHHRITGR
jgi:phytoene synthase